MKDKVVTVLMTHEEAKIFDAVLLNKETIVLLLNTVIGHKNASISLNFDNQGILQSITRNDSLYKRKYHLTENNTL